MSFEAFSPDTRAWFQASFDAPTDAQTAGWPPISRGAHTLLLAPTGSGKTLAAFLWAIDRLITSPPPAQPGTRVLYLSPLRALAVDIEKNLRSPLAGIAHAAERAERREVEDARPGIRRRWAGGQPVDRPQERRERLPGPGGG